MITDSNCGQCLGKQHATVEALGVSSEQDIHRSKAVELANIFSGCRSTRGDGDSLFRSVVYALLQDRCQPSEDSTTSRSNFFGLVNKLPELSPACVELLLLLEKKLDESPNGWLRSVSWINNEDSHFDYCLVQYFRCVVAQFLRLVNDKETAGDTPCLFEFKLSDVIQANFSTSVDNFIEDEVLKTNQEVQDIVLIALSEALRLKIFVWMLDDNEEYDVGLLCVSTTLAATDSNSVPKRNKRKAQEQKKELLELTLGAVKDSTAISSKQNGLHLLVRPGQYSILYNDEHTIEWNDFNPMFREFCKLDRHVFDYGAEDEKSTVITSASDRNGPFFELFGTVVRLLYPTEKEANVKTISPENPMERKVGEIKSELLNHSRHLDVLQQDSSLMFAAYEDFTAMSESLYSLKDYCSSVDISNVIFSRTFRFPYTTAAWTRKYSKHFDASDYLIFSRCFDLVNSYELGTIGHQDLVRWLGDWCRSVITCIRRAGVLTVCDDKLWAEIPTTPFLNTVVPPDAPILSPTRNFVVTSGRKRKLDEYAISPFGSLR